MRACPGCKTDAVIEDGYCCRCRQCTLPPELAAPTLLSERPAHFLKTWPAFFVEVAAGRKTFEARKADRDYRVGDTLVLQEWDPAANWYSGREVRRSISYMLTGPGFGVEAGYCILALACSDNDQAHPTAAEREVERKKDSEL